MKPSDIKWAPIKKRGRYTNDFKRQLIEACAAPGVSTASIALANGINANILWRWVAEHRNNPEIGGVSVKAEPKQPEPEFIRLDSEVREHNRSASRLNLHLECSVFRISVSGSVSECAEFVRALCK
jgi:transposase